MNWLEIKSNLLRSECSAFTILRDERFSPPMYNATKWVPDKPKVTLGRFDSLEAAQQACEGAV